MFGWSCPHHNSWFIEPPRRPWRRWLSNSICTGTALKMKLLVRYNRLSRNSRVEFWCFFVHRQHRSTVLALLLDFRSLRIRCRLEGTFPTSWPLLRERTVRVRMSRMRKMWWDTTSPVPDFPVRVSYRPVHLVLSSVARHLKLHSTVNSTVLNSTIVLLLTLHLL